ncbi:hypothetical protein FKW77_005578 [Venturia effusa]|uniref:Uncharacterized protein n=1 Tax=Venturia effusa TaxID=50376 RepID=A0A517KWF1_9PEZI|nr:hypothetical protein FKW77_005578 [Venturia effusa]
MHAGGFLSSFYQSMPECSATMLTSPDGVPTPVIISYLAYDHDDLEPGFPRETGYVPGAASLTSTHVHDPGTAAAPME